MNINIRLTKALASLNNGEKNATCSLPTTCNMGRLIDVLDQDMTGIKQTLINPAGDIRDDINIYVNGENIRYMEGIETQLSDGDQVGFIPAAAAG